VNAPMLILFCVCAALITYVYAGYPLLLSSGALGRRQSLVRAHREQPPLVSVIIPAHNEEASIAAKIENLLASTYPRERLEIFIGSDGSCDRTEEIVSRYANDGVTLISFPQQHGKSAIQNGLVALANGSILIFTDADCFFAPDTLSHLVEYFSDSTVGLVTGRPIFENRAETRVTRNESIYLRYETWLREEESARGILTLASGSLFAMRRKLWQPLHCTVGDDFVLPLRVARAGFRNVLDSRCVAVTRLTQNEPFSMFRMKVRIIAKDLRALLSNPVMLNPFRDAGAAVALWSHKLLRWLVPYFLLALFASNACLVRVSTFRVLLSAQVIFYALAVAGMLLGEWARHGIFSVPASFCIVNAAAFFGTLSCAFGRTFGRWTPARAVSHTRSSPIESPGAHG
jgi:cellulose synthase/poly-beta-1,6-N-acetylglucosamine synthase-like glycosyltransferase